MFQLADIIALKTMIVYFANKGSKICELLLRKWDILRELTFILQIPLRATIELQKYDIGLSDAYGIWTKMKLHLQACLNRKNYKTSLAHLLIQALEQRNNAIFANPFMDCALFLDPRFRSHLLLDETRKENAVAMLLKLWQRISENAPNDAGNTSTISFEFDAQGALNAMMEQMEPTATNVEDGTRIGNILNSFNPERLSCEKSVLEFWESVKMTHPELYKLATVVYAIPPTEVQIERDFSRLNFVFTDRRCRLQSERLHDIMMISINPEFFYLVRDEEIEALKLSL